MAQLVKEIVEDFDARVLILTHVKALGHDYYVVRSVADVASILSLPC